MEISPSELVPNRVPSTSMTNLEIKTLPFALHVLVCTNSRPITPGEKQKASCGPLGAEEVRVQLKAWLHEQIQIRAKLTPGLGTAVKLRVNGSGCLDFCKKGIAIAVYPKGDFTLFVKNDEESLRLVKAQLSERLDEIEVQVRSAAAGAPTPIT